jgi:hypothetical protein
MNECASDEVILTATKSWLLDIVIGLNFCPFAKKVWVNNEIRYHIIKETSPEAVILQLIAECELLLANPTIDTTLLILPIGFQHFEDYLDLVEIADAVVDQLNYRGIFQLASFHPEYCFAEVEPSDEANFTNRSPFPMLHIIREASIEKVLKYYPEPEKIPENNITVARSKGAEYFKHYLNSTK